MAIRGYTDDPNEWIASTILRRSDFVPEEGQAVTDRVAVILQARSGSSRLPGKVLADLSGRPMLAFLVERLKRCSSVDRVILATTDLKEDDALASLGATLGLTVCVVVAMMFSPGMR